jgi:hypothetical protein
MKNILTLLASLLLSAAALAVPPVITLTATPTSGVVPFPYTVTWNCTGGSLVTVSGAWSGTRPLVGTENFTKITPGAASASVLNLRCETAPVTTGSAVLSWGATTQNTDGSTITDLQGYIVHYGPNATPGGTGWQEVQSTIAPSLLTYTVNNLPAGTWYFSVQAINQAQVRSVYSNVPSKVIVGTPAEFATASVTVTGIAPPPTPRAPTGVTVAQVAGQTDIVAYTLTDAGKRSIAVAGFIAAGRNCYDQPVFTYRSRSYKLVDQADVRWWATTKTDRVAAPCI